MRSCSFCHKKLSEISLLIVDTPEKGKHKASICNECIGVCCEIMFEAIQRAKSFYESNPHPGHILEKGAKRPVTQKGRRK